MLSPNRSVCLKCAWCERDAYTNFNNRRTALIPPSLVANMTAVILQFTVHRVHHRVFSVPSSTPFTPCYGTIHGSYRRKASLWEAAWLPMSIYYDTSFFLSVASCVVSIVPSHGGRHILLAMEDSRATNQHLSLSRHHPRRGVWIADFSPLQIFLANTNETNLPNFKSTTLSGLACNWSFRAYACILGPT